MFKILLSLITPIAAHTDIQTFKSSPVLIQWPSYGQKYEYMIEVYDDFTQDLVSSSNWLEENRFEVELDLESLYLWKLYIRERGKFCTDEYQCLNIESGYFYLSLNGDNNNEHVVEEIVEDVVDKKAHIEEKQSNTEGRDDLVLGESTEKTPDIKEPTENKKGEEKNIIEKTESKEDSCLYKYNIDKKEFHLENCNIKKPLITSATYERYSEEYIIYSTGEYKNLIDVRINTVGCKNFDIWNTKTWFRCDEVFIRSDKYENVNIDYQAYFLTSKIVSPSNYIFKDDSFEISTVIRDIPKKILVKGYFSLKHNNKWLDQEMYITLPVKFEEKEESNRGIYSFPFNKIIYVNQWHGCTDYQCPHKGIDFGSIRENIYASNNGVVVSKGYDTYSGECNSGGNYLVIKYDSGHHMAYMHLDKSYVKVNEKVKGGDLIAISGNSGSHNCQPLGYHLHFELREGRSQKTHVDPVPFININWNLVKTNKSNLFPKRLSGDNPHPNF